MSKATFKTKSQVWDILWKIPAPAGKKYAYGRERITDRDFLTLGKKAQDARQREMDALAAQRERDAASGVESTAPAPAPAPRKETAVETLSRLQRLTRSGAPKVEREAHRIRDEFAAWLAEHHPTAEISGISYQMTRAYGLDYLHGVREYATATIKQHIKRLGWIFRELGETSHPELKNPFVYGKIMQSLPPDDDFQREAVSPLDFGRILDEITRAHDGIAGEDERLAFNLFAAFYLAIVAGWRAGDISSKKWEDIDFDNEIIKNYHHKTRKSSAVKTHIGITKTGLHILKKLRAMNGTHEAHENMFVFTEKRMQTTERQDEKNKARFQYLRGLIFDKLNLTPKMKRGLKQGTGEHRELSTTSFHSLRVTVISYLLGVEKMPDSLVHALVGHAPKDVEAKHYNKFTPDDFRRCSEKLERAFIRPALADMMKKPVLPCFIPIIKGVDAIGVMDEPPAQKRMKEIRETLIENMFHTLLGAAGLNMDDMIFYFGELSKINKRGKKSGANHLMEQSALAAVQRERAAMQRKARER